MKKHIEFTDAEVYELENLFIQKFEQLEFKPIDFDKKANIIVSKKIVYCMKHKIRKRMFKISNNEYKQLQIGRF